jgi:hypothetical protein
MTTACQKVGIQLPSEIEGISHGEAYAWFEGAQNFVTRLVCDKKQLAPHDDVRVLLQR